EARRVLDQRVEAAAYRQEPRAHQAHVGAPAHDGSRVGERGLARDLVQALLDRLLFLLDRAKQALELACRATPRGWSGRRGRYVSRRRRGHVVDRGGAPRDEQQRERVAEAPHTERNFLKLTNAATAPSKPPSA